MSEETHSDLSMVWLKVFFVCFVLVIVGIGSYTLCTYHVDAPEPKPAGGHGGMILPQDGQYAPHVFLNVVA